MGQRTLGLQRLLTVGCSLALVMVALGGCASQQALTEAKGKLAAALVRPVMGFAVEDAQTTLAWIEEHVRVGRLSVIDAEQARRCPKAVLGVAELRERVESSPTESRKGLIYLGTLNRFGGPTAEREFRAMLAELIAACGELVPMERFLPYLR